MTKNKITQDDFEPITKEITCKIMDGISILEQKYIEEVIKRSCHELGDSMHIRLVYAVESFLGATIICKVAGNFCKEFYDKKTAKEAQKHIKELIKEVWLESVGEKF